MKKIILILLLIPFFSKGQGIYRAPKFTGVNSSAYVGLSTLVSGKPTLYHVRLDSIVGVAGGALSYPNTTLKYLNGYGNFPSLNTDSIPEGTTNKFLTSSKLGKDFTFTSNILKSGYYVNILDYGAIADLTVKLDGAMTSGLATLTSATGTFTSGDIGKLIVVKGAGIGSVDLVSTISSVQSATSITLANNASVTVSSKEVDYGTNNATALANAVASGLSVYIPNGDYFTNAGVTLADKQNIFGYGDKAHIKQSGNGRLITIGNQCYVYGLWLDGMGKAALNNFASGIFAYQKIKWVVENCTITNFAGASGANGGGGIEAVAISPANSEGARILNCFIDNNNAGINYEDRGEYIMTSNCLITNNTVGVCMQAGNGYLDNCNIQLNATGFKMINGVNPGHGGISNCAINHNTVNNLDINSQTIGMSFTNCKFFSGKATISNSTEVRFVNCDFHTLDTFYLTNNTNIFRIGCFWGKNVAGTGDIYTKVISGEDFNVIADSKLNTTDVRYLYRQINTVDSITSNGIWKNSGTSISNGNTNFIATVNTDAATTIADKVNNEVLNVNITANRVLTMPTAVTGKRVTVQNRNTASFSWTYNSSPAVKDAAGNAVTSLPNGVTDVLESDGTNWIITSSSGREANFIAGQAEMTATSGAINTTETDLVSYTIPANSVQAGRTYKITCYGTCTSTTANASNLRVRLGTAGTSSDAIAAVITPTAAASGTSIPFYAVFYVTVYTIGSSGTMVGNGSLNNNGVTGLSAAAVVVGTPTSAVAINTTVSNIIHLSYVSAATTTTSTFQIASIEIVKR